MQLEGKVLQTAEIMFLEGKKQETGYCLTY